MSDAFLHPNLARAIDALQIIEPHQQQYQQEHQQMAMDAVTQMNVQQEHQIAVANSSSSTAAHPPLPSSHEYQPQLYAMEEESQGAPPPPISIGLDCTMMLAQASTDAATSASSSSFSSSEILPLVHSVTRAQGFSFLVAPLSLPLPSGCNFPLATSQHQLSFTAPDSLMCAGSWSHTVVGEISPWIQLDACVPRVASRHQEQQPTTTSPSSSSPIITPSHSIRLASESAFAREIAWATHLNLPAVMIRLPLVHHTNTPDVSNLARCIQSALLKTSNLQIWCIVPMIATSSTREFQIEASLTTTSPSSTPIDPWLVWDRVRNLCESHRRLHVALEIGSDLPSLEWDDEGTKHDLTTPAPASSSADSFIFSRWLGEPIRSVILPTSVFISNKAGFPVLTKAHQKVAKRLFGLKGVQWCLKDDDEGESDGEIVEIGLDQTGSVKEKNTTVSKAGLSVLSNAASSSFSSSSHRRDISAYTSYIRHLHTAHMSVLHTPRRAFELAYYDHLQAPLQPLADHLESGVYEVFEKDPVKYQLYEQAITQALMERQRKHDVESATTTASSPTYNILVVGAGRGPLVRCVLRSAAHVGVPVEVYALEKNPNALETLYSLKQNDPTFSRVNIIASDMREWRVPSSDRVDFADILVSELLGSFGDNELSPECLDGALKFLKADVGISIPENSVSYLVPISSSTLWNEVSRFSSSSATTGVSAFETSYVCAMLNVYRMAQQIKPVWKFVHKRNGSSREAESGVVTEGEWNEKDNASEVMRERDAVQMALQAFGSNPASAPSTAAATPSNSRHSSLTFHIPLSATLHGFAGYFTSKLYGDIELSTIPGVRHSKDMASWFPIYFPLRTPISLPSSSSLRVDFWRCCTARRVWYEWALSEPIPSPIHNPNARSAFIGL